MEQFFSKDFSGAPFELFGTGHLIALAVILLVNLSFVFVRRSGEPVRKSIRYSLAALLLLDEVAWHAWNYVNGQWTVQNMLPLHLCSLLVFLSAYMLLTRSYRIYEFAYFMGIAGATQALLTPDAGVYGFPHFRAFQVMVSHGCIVMAAVYMTVVEGFRPTWSSYLRVIVGTNVYMLFVGLVNRALGSNYLFIAHKPETASLLDVLGPWPWYILAMEALGLTLCLLLYLPFAVRDWRENRRAAQLTAGRLAP